MYPYFPSELTLTLETREVWAGAGLSPNLGRGLWAALLPLLYHPLCPQESGLSAWLGDKLTPLQNVPAPAIAFIISLLVAVFTECTSNVATTTLFLPILASMVSSSAEISSSPRCSCHPFTGATCLPLLSFPGDDPSASTLPQALELGTSAPDSAHPW